MSNFNETSDFAAFCRYKQWESECHRSEGIQPQQTAGPQHPTQAQRPTLQRPSPTRPQIYRQTPPPNPSELAVLFRCYNELKKRVDDISAVLFQKKPRRRSLEIWKEWTGLRFLAEESSKKRRNRRTALHPSRNPPPTLHPLLNTRPNSSPPTLHPSANIHLNNRQPPPTLRTNTAKHRMPLRLPRNPHTPNHLRKLRIHTQTQTT
ncbi:hypothetical protein BGZ57DRAFT_620075 [Hyaloscypha finlandica]|nr:hypothetical protein BGZ57DRAFT_620075 [Hyaloscypha finlandica]